MTEGNIFSGLKVVDLSSFIAGPGAATILSDFGADVIKVEPPEGELWRIGQKIPPQPHSEEPYPFQLANRNKRGVALNLKAANAQQVLQRLANWADVFIVNTPHSARKKLKLEYDDVAHWNPRLIYADLTGFGENGPDATLPGFDLTAYWARSGLLFMTRDAGEPPTWPVAGSGDNATAVCIYAAILTALYRRERTGKGSYVTTSLLAAGVWSASVFIQAALCGASFYGLHDRTHQPASRARPGDAEDRANALRETRPSCAASRSRGDRHQRLREADPAGAGEIQRASRLLRRIDRDLATEDRSADRVLDGCDISIDGRFLRMGIANREAVESAGKSSGEGGAWSRGAGDLFQ